MSRYFKPSLADDYEDFLLDPNRLALEEEMALTRTLMWDRIREMEKMDVVAAWAQANKLWHDANAAKRKKQPVRFDQIFESLGSVITEGRDARETRAEIRQLANTVRQLVNTQRQLYVDVGEFLTRGMVMRLFGNFMESVKTHVQTLEGGPKALADISADLAAGIGGFGGERTLESRRDSQSIEGHLAD